MPQKMEKWSSIIWHLQTWSPNLNTNFYIYCSKVELVDGLEGVQNELGVAKLAKHI
jgi:hypothetical protein